MGGGGVDDLRNASAALLQRPTGRDGSRLTLACTFSRLRQEFSGTGKSVKDLKIVVLQYVWGQDVDRFLKLGNFASTTNKHDRRDRENEFCMLAFSCKSNIGRVNECKKY